MKNRKKATIEMDDEFIAQLDFLRSDHDSALQMIDQQMQDIQKLIAILIENAIPIPDKIIEKYVRHSGSVK